MENISYKTTCHMIRVMAFTFTAMTIAATGECPTIEETYKHVKNLMTLYCCSENIDIECILDTLSFEEDEEEWDIEDDEDSFLF